MILINILKSIGHIRTCKRLRLDIWESIFTIDGNVKPTERRLIFDILFVWIFIFILTSDIRLFGYGYNL